MDRNKAKMLSDALRLALKDFEKDFGVKVDIRGGRYDGTTYTPKIILAEVNASGVAQTREMAALKLRRPDLVGKIFRHPRNGQQIEFTGYNTRAPKNPFNFKNLSTGQAMKAGEWFTRGLVEVQSRAVAAA